VRLIIGLGNPGENYKNNRHNVGYLAVDEFNKKQLPKDFVVKKTGVFMNESGEIVKKLVEQYKVDLSNLWVIHDDLDIPLGSYKIQKGRGPKIHKGIISIDEKLGSSDYWHVRIGVDNRNPENRIPGEEYVLQDFTDEEKEILGKVVKEVCKKLATS